MKYIIMIFLALSFSAESFSQSQIRRLPTSINHPGINLYSPFISADGNTMIFISDNAEDGVLTPFLTVREGDWKAPATLPRTIHTRLSFLRGYSLNADGKKIYFSTVKSPSVGGYDLFWSEWKGYSWTQPVNFAKPINSPKHDACATFTPDEKTMYFMRCEKMEQDKAEQCRIFSAVQKPNGQWDEPVELPANINKGNSQTPRIMADGETLIFSSDKHTPSKGGMDLYVSKKKGTNLWSDPQPLEFVNSEKNDQYVSVTSAGRYLLKDAPGARKNELVEFLIPNDLRPKGLMKVEGTVLDPSGSFVAAYLTVVDAFARKQVFSGRPATDGSFVVYLKEGNSYEFSVDPEKDDVTFYTRSFDLMTDQIPQSEKLSIVLKPASSGDVIDLKSVTFSEHGSDLQVSSSRSELERLARILSGNKTLKVDFQFLLTGYQEDSVQSSPDLTEVIYDSIATQYDEIDSLGQIYQVDTMIVETTFHNNRIPKQAQSVIDYFVSKGLDPSRFTFTGTIQPASLPEEKSLVVKAVLK